VLSVALHAALFAGLHLVEHRASLTPIVASTTFSTEVTFVVASPPTPTVPVRQSVVIRTVPRVVGTHRSPALAAQPPSTSTAPTTPSPASTAPSVSQPQTQPQPNGIELLRAARTDVMRLGAEDLTHTHLHPPATNDVIRGDLATYFGDSADNHRHEQIPGASVYYQPMRTAIERTWQPQSARTPSVADALLSTVLTDSEGYQRVLSASEGDLRPGARSSAMTALDAAHPNSPMLSNPASPYARAQANARVTRTVVEVDQDANARIVSVRVVQRSGVELFDHAAMEAIQRAVASLEPHAMPGGWRSRWMLEVTRTRNPPPVGMLPSLPDQGPAFGAAVGGTFDESTGTGSVSVPFAVNERRNVRLLWSRALAAVVVQRDGGA
jgi:TonB family protein